MGNHTVQYASQNIAEAIAKKFGTQTDKISIPLRRNDDVPKFIDKIRQAKIEASRSTLKFD